MNNIETLSESKLCDLLFPRFKTATMARSIDCTVTLPFQVSGKVVKEISAMKGTGRKILETGKGSFGTKKSILVVPEVDASVFDNISNLAGIVTSSIPSHYKIVSSAEGIPVALTERITIDEIINTQTEISIDGIGQSLYPGMAEINYPNLGSQEIQKIIRELKKYSPMTVRVNADNPRQAEIGRLFGAEGTGPVRTEYMFFQKERLPLFQRFLLGKANDEDKEELKRFQIEDFQGIFTALQGYRVCIRLLDPPINEFFPKASNLDKGSGEKLAVQLGIDYTELKDLVERIQESNPMLGWRGSRLGITNPEIYQMQVEAAITSLVNCRSNGINAQLEILVPLVMNGNEMRSQYEMIQRTAIETLIKMGYSKENAGYTIGAMIEVPQACLDAGNIARYCTTFSFGTNDLAQCTYGISRDDANFMQYYLGMGLLENDPFNVISDDGVGQLMRCGIGAGRKVNNSLLAGVCGEQAAQRRSIQYLLGVNQNPATKVDYIAVSPYKVPLALLRAAQESVVLNQRQVVSVN